MDRRAIPEGMRFDCWRAADSWPLRRFDWPAPAARGNLLFLGGRGDFVEKYLEALSHWHDGGWSLTGFDWRGQGGSGRYLADPLICHIPDFDPLLGDLETFVDGWVTGTRGPHIIVAHSMGAQMALRLLARRTGLVDGAVLLAPMLDLRPLPASVARLAAGTAIRLGHGEQRIWRRDLGNYGGRMTSCPERQEDKIWWKAARPDIASGAPSWGWLRAACASIAKLPVRDLGSIAIPLLILASKRDPVIDIAVLHRAAARLPDAELRLFEGKGHELLREADGVRLPVLRAIDAFLGAILGSADAPPPAIRSVTVRPDKGGKQARRLG
jgi:lysophospholipase